MIREPAGESALEMAARRLERAVAALEQRLSDAPAAASGGDLFGQATADAADVGRLKAELDEARQREKQLEEAGAEASAALGRAILEIRSALNGNGASQAASEDA